MFLFGARRLLLVLHAGASIVLVGSATHHALRMRFYLRGDFSRVALERLYARVVAVSYALTFTFGALLYPSFRVHVRAAFLDASAPDYARLFDVKEFYAAVALVVALSLGGSSYVLEPKEEPELARVYAWASVLVACVVWFEVIAGLLVTSVRGVG